MRISDYTPMNKLRINFGGEKINIRLDKELAINEDGIDDELKEQANSYGFIMMLHKKLLTVFHDLKDEREATYARLYIKFKELKSDSTGRPISDEMAKQKAILHKDYRMITKACIKAKDDADAVYSALKAFEQRASMLQTLSSNNRNQR